ncbi:tetratricopeptide repeat protein [Alloalcanivorax gelatiniphagus]|uniref:tetratricopeptide repeat protein n=1 Tax=Alloalcanivorax gelatiniphagus TaxID=1194167 RepID=UPI0014776502|nr:tetratricopeptide repeat protein [Alloalcanivorax gelatiniphagus]
MASQITNYRVFIASPGGLESERKVFRELLSSHNEADAIDRGCHFQTIGWEITLGGMGRPQSKINEDLKSCDLFVLVLWDRWGSPTGAKEGYTSGTHEEYMVALDCLKSEELPMRDIVVFFKAVDHRRMSDPGPQLSAVLDFKRSLEKERNLLFETFDTPEAFGEKLRRHVAKWTREHSGDTSVEDKELANDTEIQSIDQSDISFIEELKSRSGDTDAEKELANDVIIKRDMHSFDRYGLFLTKAERYEDAKTLYQQMHDLADGSGDTSWASTAIARIGGIYRAQGRNGEALSALQNALQLKERAGDKKGEASVHIWIGDLTASQRKPDVAIEHYKSALSICPNYDNSRKADLKWKVAKCHAELGNMADAKIVSDEVFEEYKKMNNKKGMQSIKHWRKARKVANKSMQQTAKAAAD